MALQLPPWLRRTPASARRWRATERCRCSGRLGQRFAPASMQIALVRHRKRRLHLLSALQRQCHSEGCDNDAHWPETRHGAARAVAQFATARNGYDGRSQAPLSVVTQGRRLELAATPLCDRRSSEPRGRFPAKGAQGSICRWPREMAPFRAYPKPYQQPRVWPGTAAPTVHGGCPCRPC